MKAQVSMATMASPTTQSHAKAMVERPTNSSRPDSTYRRQTRTNSTAGVRNALNTFFDFNKRGIGKRRNTQNKHIKLGVGKTSQHAHWLNEFTVDFYVSCGK